MKIKVLKTLDLLLLHKRRLFLVLKIFFLGYGFIIAYTKILCVVFCSLRNYECEYVWTFVESKHFFFFTTFTIITIELSFIQVIYRYRICMELELGQLSVNFQILDSCET